MSGTSFGMILEGLVAILLVVTIAYCFIVNRKLTALRADQAKLRDTVQLLDRSTRNAENIMGELRETAALTQEELDERIEYGRSTLNRLSTLLNQADQLVPQEPELRSPQKARDRRVDRPIRPIEQKPPTLNETPKPGNNPVSVRRVPLKTDMRLSNLMRTTGEDEARQQSADPRTTRGARSSGGHQ